MMGQERTQLCSSITHLGSGISPLDCSELSTIGNGRRQGNNFLGFYLLFWQLMESEDRIIVPPSTNGWSELGGGQT